MATCTVTMQRAQLDAQRHRCIILYISEHCISITWSPVLANKCTLRTPIAQVDVKEQDRLGLEPDWLQQYSIVLDTITQALVLRVCKTLLRCMQASGFVGYQTTCTNMHVVIVSKGCRKLRCCLGLYRRYVQRWKH